MKPTLKISLYCLITLFLISSSCTDDNYPKNSILGTWRCEEEGTVYGYRRYDVMIDYYSSDSTTIVLNNFYNLGFDLRVFCSISDTLITINETDNPLHNFSGTGHVMRDFSAIYWNYKYFGFSVGDPEIQAVFRRL